MPPCQQHTEAPLDAATDAEGPAIVGKQLRFEEDVGQSRGTHQPTTQAELHLLAKMALRQPASCDKQSSIKVPLGREQQYTQVARLVGEFVEGGKGGSLYVSGLPGTGKTHTVKQVSMHHDCV